MDASNITRLRCRTQVGGYRTYSIRIRVAARPLDAETDTCDRMNDSQYMNINYKNPGGTFKLGLKLLGEESKSNAGGEEGHSGRVGAR